MIGAGTGGYVAAIRAAQLGKTVAVVEKQSALGGTCLIWGCIPTKALLEHAHALKVIQQAAEWGVTIPSGTPAINMTQVHARKDKIVGGLTKGIEFLFKKNKITWVKGTARLAGPGKSRRRRRRQADPRGERDHHRDRVGAAQCALRDDRSHAHHHQRRGHPPEGGSEVARHPGQRRRGSRVRVDLPALRQRGHDHRAGAASGAGRGRGGVCGAREVLQEAGHHGADRHKGHEGDAHRRAVSPSRRETPDGKTNTITADVLLVATGRGPVTTGLGAEEAGIAMERGYIKVDDLYRTSVPGISAIGDVITLGTGVHPQLAHVSSMEGIIAAERIAGKDGSAAQLRPRSRLHLLRSRDRQRRPHRGSGKGARLRREDRHVPLWRARSSQDGRRIRGVREDRCRQEVPMKCWACT